MGTELLACARAEMALLLAERDGVAGARERTPGARWSDVARGRLLDAVLSALPRALMLANESMIAAAGSSAAHEMFERSSLFDAAHANALGVRAGGSLYAPNGARGGESVIPLGFVLRRSTLDLFALCDPCVGPAPARVASVPFAEITWRPVGDNASMGAVATVLGALSDAGRIFAGDPPVRVATTTGRPSFATLIEAALDASLAPEALRITLPLRHGATEVDAQRVSIELVARALQTTGGTLEEWTAQAQLEGRAPVAVPLGGPMLLRDFASRWSRALQVLPRYFPPSSGTSARYLRAPAGTDRVDPALGEHGTKLAEFRG
jgi:hypothetical protein